MHGPRCLVSWGADQGVCSVRAVERNRGSAATGEQTARPSRRARRRMVGSSRIEHAARPCAASPCAASSPPGEPFRGKPMSLMGQAGYARCPGDHTLVIVTERPGRPPGYSAFRCPCQRLRLYGGGPGPAGRSSSAASLCRTLVTRGRTCEARVLDRGRGIPSVSRVRRRCRVAYPSPVCETQLAQRKRGRAAGRPSLPAQTRLARLAARSVWLASASRH
jgi:hypothetical protein